MRDHRPERPGDADALAAIHVNLPAARRDAATDPWARAYAQHVTALLRHPGLADHPGPPGPGWTPAERVLGVFTLVVLAAFVAFGAYATGGMP